LKTSDYLIPVKEAQREALFILQLKNPFIITIFDHFSVDDYYCIIMEYVDGGDLASQIKSQKSPFEESFIISVFSQLVFALQECKIKNIIHRDIKPANILLTSSGFIKLADFGLSSQLSSSQSQTKSDKGTPLYMAPEVINRISYSFSVDIFSLGCVLYELMTLKPAFEGENPNETMYKIAKGEYDHFSKLKVNYSEDLIQAVEKMLIVEVESRITIEEICKL
jgi:NIMA (never in mitosis gene a)-related kinase